MSILALKLRFQFGYYRFTEEEGCVGLLQSFRIITVIYYEQISLLKLL